MVKCTDNEQVKLNQVEFLPAISQQFKGGEMMKKDSILQYIVAQHKQGSTGSIRVKDPGAGGVKDHCDLQANTSAIISRSNANSDPESSMPCRDIQVGTHRRHGEYPNVYAYLKRGAVSFRLHNDEIISFGSGCNEQLVILKKEVDFEDIIFATAYQGNSMELVKAAIQASLHPRRITGTSSIRNEERPTVSLGQQENNGLIRALQNHQNSQQALIDEIKKSEAALQKHEEELTKWKQRLHEKEESLKKRESEISKAEKQEQQAGKSGISFAIPKKTPARDSIAIHTPQNVLRTGGASNESLAHSCPNCDEFEKLSMNAAATFNGKDAEIKELTEKLTAVLEKQSAEMNNLIGQAANTGVLTEEKSATMSTPSTQPEADKKLMLLPLRLNGSATFDNVFEQIPDDKANACMFMEKVRAFIPGKEQYNGRQLSRFGLVHQIPTIQVNGELIETGHEYLGTKYSLYKKGEFIKLVQELEPGMMYLDGDKTVISWTCFMETMANADELWYLRCWTGAVMGTDVVI